MNPGKDSKGQSRLMVNFQEVSLPDQARRSLAQGVARPDFPTRRRKLGDVFVRDVVRCPECTGWRPMISVVLTKIGWLCDGCISAKRRDGEMDEWD